MTLVLFDFSLAHTPVDNIRAGTPSYLDPFLRRRRPPRWELYAERFAMAMTLYEMATGVLPQWGDGQSEPALRDCEVSLDSALFDPAVRDGLSAFCTRALHSDYRQHFDNAEERRRAWQRIFTSVDQPSTETDHGALVDLEGVLSAVKETDILILVLSPDSVQSKWVEQEWRTFQEMRKVVLLVLYSECEVPTEINKLQIIKTEKEGWYFDLLKAIRARL